MDEVALHWAAARGISVVGLARCFLCWRWDQDVEMTDAGTGRWLCRACWPRHSDAVEEGGG